MKECMCKAGVRVKMQRVEVVMMEELKYLGATIESDGQHTRKRNAVRVEWVECRGDLWQKDSSKIYKIVARL